MAGGVHIILFGAACTVSIFNMAVTVSDDMCTTLKLFSTNNHTFHYSPNAHELKKCCCNLSATDSKVSVSISSNATFFELVFPTNGTVKSLRNETGLSLSNSIQFCGKKSESGFVIITGTNVFQVGCTFSSSVIVSTTVNLPYTSTPEESVTANTAPAASGSASVPQNENPGDDIDFSSNVIGIIIGSVAGVLVIVTGVVISCIVYRKRTRTTEDDEGKGREGHDTLMADNILYSHENSAYSLAKGAEPVDADDPGREDVDDLVMSENCLYNHEQESSIDRNFHERQGQYQTVGEQGQSGETSAHREEADFSHLYAKVDKTSGKHN